jgi:hypothetical protein
MVSSIFKDRIFMPSAANAVRGENSRLAVPVRDFFIPVALLKLISHNLNFRLSLVCSVTYKCIAALFWAKLRMKFR